MLLKSNIYNYDIDSFIKEHFLEYISIEELSTIKLCELSSGHYYSYSKSTKSFKKCYYEDCCSLKSNKGDCDMRRRLSGDKFEALLKGTEFEYLLDISKSGKV
jgi:hypothetical protein